MDVQREANFYAPLIGLPIETCRAGSYQENKMLVFEFSHVIQINIVYYPMYHLDHSLFIWLSSTLKITTITRFHLSSNTLI